MFSRGQYNVKTLRMYHITPTVHCVVEFFSCVVPCGGTAVKLRRHRWPHLEHYTPHLPLQACYMKCPFRQLVLSSSTLRIEHTKQKHAHLRSSVPPWCAFLWFLFFFFLRGSWSFFMWMEYFYFENVKVAVQRHLMSAR